MSYLADSDRVADYLKGRVDAVRFIDDLRPDGLAISVVTYGEVYEGVAFGRDAEAQERAFETFLVAVTVLPVTEAEVRRFALLRGELRRSGFTIGDMDLLIAATALEHDLVLATRNVRDFSRVPGLRML